MELSSTLIDKKKNWPLYYLDQFILISTKAFLKCICAIVPKKIAAKINNATSGSYVISNTIGLMVFNALGGLLMFVTNIKLANTLGAALFGIYSYYLAIGEVGMNLTRYGRNKTMLRELVQNPENNVKLITHTFWLGIINLAVYVLIILVFHSFLDVKISIASLLIIIAPSLMSLDFLPVYEALKLMSWHSIYYLIQKILFLSLIWIALYIAGGIDLTYLGISLFSSWIIVLIFQFKEILGQLGINLFAEFSLTELCKQYKTNFLIAITCLLGVAFGPLNRMILNLYVDEKAVGIYAAALQIYLMSQFLMHQIGRVGNPIMAAAGKEDCPHKKRMAFLHKYLIIMLVSTLPFFIPLFFFPGVITRVLFTSEYAELSTLLPIFAVYIVFLSAGVVYTQFLISTRCDKQYFTIYLITAVVTLLMAFITIPRYGIVGAALSLCVPHGLACVGYAIISYKQ